MRAIEFTTFCGHGASCDKYVWEADPSQTLDLSSAAANAAILPLDLPIEGEKKQNYDPKQFYPVKLGEIFHDRYQVVVKVGFGGHSTVWLARNLHRYVCILILNAINGSIIDV